MNSGVENLEQMLKMENSKPVILIKIIVIHISKCTQADPIIFSIFKEKSDINFQYKNLDVQINTSVLNGESKRKLQQLSSKNISDESDRNNGIYDNFTESTNAQKQRRGSRESARSDRKKPRFLNKWYC